MGTPVNTLFRVATLALLWATSAPAAVTETARIDNQWNTTYNAHWFGYSSAVSPDGQTLVVGAGGATGLGAVYVYTRGDAGWGSPNRLDLPPIHNDAGFGASVDMTDDVLVIGAPNTASYRGSAFVYRKIGADWMLEQELAPAVPKVSHSFGGSVAIDGDTILVGSPGANEVSVFVLGADLWSEQQVLVPFDEMYHTYGNALDIDGDRAVVGDGRQWVNGQRFQGAAYAYRRTAEGWVDDGKLVGSDSAAYDEFATSVALEGDMIVIGAPIWGVAYVFLRDEGGWNEQARLLTNQNDRFGHSVDIEEGAILVGAPSYAYYDPGLAHYYEPSGSTWVLSQTIAVQDRGGDDRFGFWVTLAGDDLVVSGIQAEIEGRVDHGIAATFSRQFGAWVETGQLYVADGAPYDAFGQQVAIDGDVLLAGTPGDDNQDIAGHGAVYVHVRTEEGWQLRQKLTDPCGGTQFGGRSLLLSGDLIVVGGTCAGVDGDFVFTFRFDGDAWAFEQSLQASDAAPSDGFGRALALDGNRLVVGAPAGVGAAYVFEYVDGTWSEVQRLLAEDGLPGDDFGRSVAIDGSLIAVGAPMKHLGTNFWQGAVYIFGHDGEQWQQQRKILAPDGDYADSLGSSLAFTSGELAAGASFEGFPIDNGAVYLFDPATGLMNQKLTVAGSEYLGRSIAATDEMLILPSARQNIGVNSQEGAAYVFVRENDAWSFRDQLRASAGASLEFGMHGAISGDRVAVGAPGADTRNGVAAGAAYVFEGMPPPAVDPPPPPPPPPAPDSSGGGGGPMPLGLVLVALAALARRCAESRIATL
jgi:hypothetical protein